MTPRNISDDATLAYLFKKNSKEAAAELNEFKASFLNLVYPVGSIYMSVNSASPEKLFGGKWERITGRFLLAATDGGAAGGNSNASIVAGYTGGEASHQLIESELPQISGSFGIHGQESGSIFYSKSGHATGTQVNNKYHTTSTSTNQKTGAYSQISPGFSFGSNGYHNNMPPYLAVYVWKRTA